MQQFFKVISCMSPEQLRRHDEEIERLMQQEAERQRQKNFESSGVGKFFFAERIETYKPTAKSAEAVEKVNRFLQDVRCGKFRTLVLCGNPGTGKTHLAAGLLYELGGLFRLSDVIREEYEAAKSFTAKYTQAELIRRYGKASFLVIDEIGRTESGATATVEKHCLYRIINERYNNRLPAVLISNLSQKDFIAYLGQASVDRLTESADFCIFDWESYRAKKGGMF